MDFSFKCAPVFWGFLVGFFVLKFCVIMNNCLHFFGLFSLYLLGCNWKVSASSSLHVSLQNFSKVFLYVISEAQLHKITVAFYKLVWFFLFSEDSTPQLIKLPFL